MKQQSFVFFSFCFFKHFVLLFIYSLSLSTYRPDTCQDDDGVEETGEAEEVCSTYYSCSEEDCVPI